MVLSYFSTFQVLFSEVFFFKNRYFLVDNFYFNSFLWVSGVLFFLLILSLLSNRFTTNKLQILGVVFFIFIYFYVTTKNILVFFFIYELFLLPSALLVFFISPNRRGVIISFYFLIWTQIGSFLVLMAVMLVFLETNQFYFNTLSSLNNFIFLLIFFGFGIKIPVWPFHYWLTKTHVEAPTYFSIYLSGFLVKTSVYGLWVFLKYVYIIKFMIFFIKIAVIGVLDSSLKMWVQVDIKKLIAYSTIQEMNMILVLILFYFKSVKYTFWFVLVHTIISSLFFYLNDLVYRRYNSRSIYTVSGLQSSFPKLFSVLYANLLMYAGFPLTLKFLVEIYLYIQLFNFNFSFFLVTLLVANWVGVFSYFKIFLQISFGDNFLVKNDISLKEILIFINFYVLLLLLTLNLV